MCPSVAGDSWRDRFGCPDSDGLTERVMPIALGANGPIWTTADGADLWPADLTQWADSDADGFGDNSSGHQWRRLSQAITGNSSADRNGCLDADGDGYSDPDLGWAARRWC